MRCLTFYRAANYPHGFWNGAVRLADEAAHLVATCGCGVDWEASTVEGCIPAA